MIILLDTNILIEDPSILSKKKKDIIFATTRSVLHQLNMWADRYSGWQSISSIVNSAIAKGILQVHDTNFPPDKEVYGYKLSPTDVDLVQYAIKLKAAKSEVAIATNDHDILDIDKKYNIKTLNITELRALFSKNDKDVSINVELKRQTDTWSRYQKLSIFLSFSAALLSIIAFFSSLTMNKIDKLISTISIWGTILLVFAVGLGVYAIRGRFRLFYGFLEFFFGFALVIRVFWPNFDYSQLKTVDLIQIVGAIYIMIRGQDNIGISLRGRKFERYWKKFSGEKGT